MYIQHRSALIYNLSGPWHYLQAYFWWCNHLQCVIRHLQRSGRQYPVSIWPDESHASCKLSTLWCTAHSHILFNQLVHENGNVYAAKKFYRLGEGEQIPSPDDNLVALKQELVIMTVVQSICNTFIAHANSKNVGIASPSCLLFSPPSMTIDHSGQVYKLQTAPSSKSLRVLMPVTLGWWIPSCPTWTSKSFLALMRQAPTVV